MPHGQGHFAGTVPGTAYELFRPEGPLAVLPRWETYQVVWSAPFSRCQQRAELPVGEFLNQLAAVLPRVLSPICYSIALEPFPRSGCWRVGSVVGPGF